MARKYRRKQSQPRRIIRKSGPSSSSKPSMSYVVIGVQDSVSEEGDPVSESENKDGNAVSATREMNPDQHLSESVVGFGSKSLAAFSHVTTNSDPSHSGFMVAPLITQQALTSSPFYHFPPGIENFQVLSPNSLNQRMLQDAALSHFAVTQESFPCLHCNQVFNQQAAREIHIQMRHNGQFLMEGNSLGGGEEGELQYDCVECGKSFQHKWNLTQHMRTHVCQSKAFPCPYCHKVFSHDCNRKIHMRAHTGEKPYKCEICGRQFSHKHNMRVHLRTHTREKPYQCPNCSKAFSHVSALKIHARVHTGEKPYTCDICGKPFSHSSTLNVHRRRHTGEKPFQCNLCTKTFARDCILKNHLKTHELSVSGCEDT